MPQGGAHKQGLWGRGASRTCWSRQTFSSQTLLSRNWRVVKPLVTSAILRLPRGSTLSQIGCRADDHHEQQKGSPVALKIPRVLAPLDRPRCSSQHTKVMKGMVSFCLLQFFLSLICFSTAFYIHTSDVLLLYDYYHVWNSRDRVQRKAVSVCNRNCKCCLILKIIFCNTEKPNQTRPEPLISMLELIPSTKPNRTWLLGLYFLTPKDDISRPGLFSPSFHLPPPPHPTPPQPSQQFPPTQFPLLWSMAFSFYKGLALSKCRLPDLWCNCFPEIAFPSPPTPRASPSLSFHPYLPNHSRLARSNLNIIRAGGGTVSSTTLTLNTHLVA